jgi:nitrite reductase (NADH) small subunit
MLSYDPLNPAITKNPYPCLCPHLGGPICDADIDGDTLSCAWHGYNFSLQTGACEDDPDLNLQRYEVRVEGDEILVKIS